MEKFYKPSEAAKFLGISKRTIKYMKKDGRIVPDKVDDTGHIFYSKSHLLKIKNGATDIMPLAKNLAGDTYKTVQNFEKRCKNGAKPAQTASEQALENGSVEKTRYLLPEIEAIPPESVQNRDKNGDIDEKTASEQALTNGSVEKTRYLISENDTISPENFQNRVTTYDIGVTAPLADNQKDEISAEIGDTSTKVISVNVIPTTKLVMPNDKFCKYFFNFSQEEYEFILKNGGTIEECKKPKVGKICSDFDVVLIDNYTSTVPLNMFDKAVVIACDSEFIAGNKFVTPAIIYRNMCGKNDGYNIEPPPEIRKAILDSVNKMMCTQITYDMSSACVHLKYNNGEKFKITATALPCKCVSGIAINGQEFETVIQLYDTSPFFNIACVKNKQLLTFNKHLLDVPKQRNTVTTISVKHYVLQRVLEIKLHNLNPVITFDDVFKKCNLTDADKMKKSRVRQEIISIMKSLQDIHDISSFTVQKNGNKYLGIEFSFPQSEFSAQSSKKPKKSRGDINPTAKFRNALLTRPYPPTLP